MGAGILARLPDCINQPIVGAARQERAGPGGPGPSGGCALLMRDVTPWLVLATDAPITQGQASDPEELAACAAAAGFTRVRVRVTDVRTGLATPAALASWRLGMAHVAPFLRALDAPGRAAVRAAAEPAVAETAAAGPLVVSMVVLTAC